MTLTREKVEGGRRERVSAGRATKSRAGSAATTAKVIPMDEEQTKGTQIDLGGSVGGVTPVVVIFRMPDGSCDKGTARHVGSEAIFVESKRTVPIGTKVAICLAHPDGRMADWGTAEGMVVWTCPAVDQFNNREGFGVSFQGRWPQPLEAAEAGGLRGAHADT